MEEATREQQREARRQKVLARSQGGHRAPVVDLATEQEGIAPEGVSAVLDEGYEDPPDGVLDAAAAAQAAEDAGKSASRLAAERRRKKILSRSTERMAKVQGDRVIRSGGAEEAAGGEEVGGGGGGSGGGESLDDMLEAAEAEFFGQQQGAGGGSAVAEAKPAAPQQAYFKTTKGGAGGGGEGITAAAGSGSAGAAQGKPSRQRPGGGAGFKSSRPEGGSASRQSPPPSGSSSGSSRAAGRRPTGNKALDKKPFDMAAIHSLSRAAGTYRPGNSGAGAGGVSSRPARKRLLGGVRFWVGVEGVVKTALLLLAGAGVGGLLLPEARAAVAQAKFEAEHMRDFANSRSRLEEFLGAGGGRNDLGGAGSSTALDVDLEKTTGSVTNEFGDFVEGVDGLATPSGEPKDESLGQEEEVQPQSEDGSVSTATSTGKGGEEAEMGEEDVVDVVADGGVISEATALFLSCVDYLVGWAHYLSSVSMPWGTGGDISCVSAIYLALFVRLAVATAFSALRVVLGLPAMPPAAPSSKPGMMMGMVLASVPALGKVFALGNLMKSIFSDTNLVVAGTVLTLALNLALEEGAGPRRLAEGVSGVLSLPFQAPEGVNGDHSKEL
ncbi:unnamed protein product [Scytosiphon promiscuus]